ncbi:MAG: c-type cytochrome [Bacteroidota bacterium]
MLRQLTSYLLALGLVGIYACQPTSQKETSSPVSASALQLPQGFVAELLYAPSENEQGSWVSITTDDQGRLITSDQYGNLYRMQPPKVGSKLSRRGVEKLPVEIGHAQGLLYAFNSLYVSVNAREGIAGRKSGLYRLQDTDQDDQFDSISTLASFEGEGEHGPHAVILGPDQQSLYVIGGNHTDLPEMDTYLRPHNWEEDQLFPAMKDPRGHAANRKAPGGWVATTDENGSHWTLFSSGYRNPYDMAFNQDGELFVFDSDMEWDMGMPWYRPIRLCHAVAGSEFGWRTGSGKFKPYYEDNLPAVVNIGQGSPTGVLYGQQSHFPSHYRGGMFLFDWSFGTIYYVRLTPSGSSYKGSKEEFISGVPFPVADGVFGKDGAMYLVTGGRKGVSGLYRISYPEPSQPIIGSLIADDNARQLRAQREALSQTFLHPSKRNIPLLWDALGHPDRFIRYTAQTGLEHHPYLWWEENFQQETQPNLLIAASIALAHQEQTSAKDLAFAKLSRISFQTLSYTEKVSYLRAVELVSIRLGAPTAIQKAGFQKQLSPAFPNREETLNQELAKLLVYLETTNIQERILDLMDGEGNTQAQQVYIGESITSRSEQYGPDIENMLKNFPPTEHVSYAFYLSQIKNNWNTAQLARYFNWLFEATAKTGGMSYRGFIDKIRLSSLNGLTDEQKAELGSLAESWDTGIDLSNLPQPKGPGNDWNKQEVLSLIWDEDTETPDYEHGKEMYEAALCAACHQMNGKGGNMGPDLSQAHSRFNTWTLMDAIISPSLDVSDQYASTMLSLTNGKKLIGRLMDETADSITLNTNPYDPSIVETVALTMVQTKDKSAVSPMPPGMLNRLNEKEVINLMAYIQSGGNPEHEIYQESE